MRCEAALVHATERGRLNCLRAALSAPANVSGNDPLRSERPCKAQESSGARMGATSWVNVGAGAGDVAKIAVARAAALAVDTSVRRGASACAATSGPAVA
mmetsp:Transcript_116887/g.324975  ORF Transcript_116887/g.324975 Transcript_116887/m.324975 type:complete len:100 (+) Transcript_116887:585-884(+)